MKRHTILLQPVISKLELQTGIRRTDTEYAKLIGVTRQQFKAMFEGDTSAVQFSTIDKLIDYFTADGMPITVGDLFTFTPKAKS